MSTKRIAVTADMENGLDSPVSGHFGHCKAFIVSTVEDGEITKVETVPNLGHASCAEPVNRLASLGVDVLITMGMGMRPFMAAQQVGLTVVRSDNSTVGDAIRTYLEGVGELMDRNRLCGGGGGGCQH
ncbi:MAG: NifB/NifX family molybdenum-iron cluster-binding protein [Promethearchaeota archaeon]